MQDRLRRFQQFQNILAELDNPHLKLPPVIHVAGTNGKGSTIAFMRAIIEATGCRVHIFTSPHLIDETERFVCASQVFSQPLYQHYLALIQPLIDQYDLGYFEHLTIMAFLMFADYTADYCLLEVGVGGQFDPTNVIVNPVATCITTVDYDHTEILGLSLTDITQAKAGIIKPNCPLFTTVTDHQCLDIILQTTQHYNSRCYQLNNDFSFHNQSIDWQVIMGEAHYNLEFPPYLLGNHQLANATLAIATLRTVIGSTINREVIQCGINQAKWPGRLERFIYKGRTIWFDGAHNPQGADALNAYFKQKMQKLHIIVAQQPAKNTPQFIKAIQDITQQLYIIHLRDHESFNQTLFAIVKQHDDTEILVTGSLYLYETLRKFLKQ